MAKRLQPQSTKNFVINDCGMSLFRSGKIFNHKNNVKMTCHWANVKALCYSSFGAKSTRYLYSQLLAKSSRACKSIFFKLTFLTLGASWIVWTT